MDEVVVEEKGGMKGEGELRERGGGISLSEAAAVC